MKQIARAHVVVAVHVAHYLHDLDNTDVLEIQRNLAVDVGMHNHVVSRVLHQAPEERLGGNCIHGQVKPLLWWLRLCRRRRKRFEELLGHRRATRSKRFVLGYAFFELLHRLIGALHCHRGVSGGHATLQQQNTQKGYR